MEYYSMLFNNSSTTNTVRGHNGNFTPNHHHAWDSWDLPTSSTSSTSRTDWTYLPPPPPPAAECIPFQAAMLHDQEKTGGGNSCSCTITSSLLCCNPDPHLTCLKLGKRQYFGDLTPPAAMMEATKRGKAGGEHAAVAVPTCQVVGCGSVLVNAKDYHRRHKVCEMHAKAPRVVLLGIDQRFCQQCSRFHALGEFDEAKRSCRRRLAGHNERRRKSSQEQNSLARKQYQGRHPMSHLLNNSECALSLLSLTNNSPWSASPSPSPDLPARCSAALGELIAENRASVFACRQLMYSNANQMGDYKLASGWAASAALENRDHVTLNLMQGPESTFGLISGHDRRPSEDGGNGDCSELWKLPLGY